MQISDLVAIGKLGNSLNKKGYIPFFEFDDFRHFLLEDVFLLFTDNRVRYVSITDIDNKGNLRFDDEEITREAAQDGDVQVMIAKADWGNKMQEIGLPVLVGKAVYLKKEYLGKVIDAFFNGAQQVMVILDQNEKEFMVPFVDHFIVKTESEKIFLKNIEGLIDL
ncbi:MAG TPA: hypothetical protein PLD62_01425 [Candidatus Cloacimonadota bacterium]|nr:hypothetical protein [Candidatus Cloacimonadota bacterium]